MILNAAILLFAVIAPNHVAPGPGVCDLITRKEAAAALGAKVPAGSEMAWDFPVEQGRSMKAKSCFYGTEVVLTRFELGASAPRLFSQYRQSLSSRSDYRIVTGVGDEAFVAKGQLAIRKGQSGIIVDVGQARGGGIPELKKEMGLGLLAVGRM
jgi:hypothetical protein